MRALISLIAVSVIALVACTTPLPSSRQLGVFNLKDTADGAGGYKIHPTAVFWEANNVNLPNSNIVPDTCLDTLYYPPDTTTAVILNQLDAGSPLLMQTPTGTGPVSQLTPDTIPGVLITYRNHTGGVAHVPGNDILFTIPGAAGGFNASSITAKTVLPLHLGPIVAQPPDSLRLTWNVGIPGESQVHISLQYISSGGAIYDRQIVCAVYDDGDFWIPKFQATKWKNAYPNQRVAAFRWMSTFNPVSEATLLLTISEFDTTKTTFP